MPARRSSELGTVVTVDGAAKTAGQLAFSKYVTQGQTVSYAYSDPVASTSSGKQYHFTGVNTGAPATGFTVSAATSITGSYVTQWLVSFDQSGIGGDSTGTVVTVDGAAKTAGQLASSKYVTQGQTVSYA